MLNPQTIKSKLKTKIGRLILASFINYQLDHDSIFF